MVTVAHGGRSALAFMKGSPEMVASLCQAESGQQHEINNMNTNINVMCKCISEVYILSLRLHFKWDALC